MPRIGEWPGCLFEAASSQDCKPWPRPCICKCQTLQNYSNRHSGVDAHALLGKYMQEDEMRVAKADVVVSSPSWRPFRVEINSTLRDASADPCNSTRHPVNYSPRLNPLFLQRKAVALTFELHCTQAAANDRLYITRSCRKRQKAETVAGQI